MTREIKPYMPFHLKTIRFQSIVATVVVSLLTLMPVNTSAQALPFCIDPNSDTDSDGFGYEDGADCQLRAPLVTNRETGLAVNLERSYWLPEDTAGERNAECSDFVFSAETNSYEFINDVFLIFNPPQIPNCEGQACGGEGTVNVLGSIGPYDTDNGLLSLHTGFIFGLWKEIGFEDPSAAGVPVFRQWNTDGGGFTQCSGILSTGEVPREESTSVCIDTDPVGDGWGWDGVTSCQISVESVCVDTPPTGDGWGWDGSSSCRVGANTETVSPNNCVDPDGDGWGWNGTASCRVDATTSEPGNGSECIDPDGDGWGWNGTASCRANGASNGGSTSECVDLDGDGWGWNGVASCRI